MGADNLQPLNLDVRQFGLPDGIAENIEYSLSLNLQEFAPALIPNNGTIIICGSSPSLPDGIDEIRQLHKDIPIIAVNGAHDFLLENLITPDIFLTVDPRGMPQNLKHANDNTIYLLASRVNIEDFKRLEGRKRVIFHSWSEDDEELIPKKKMRIGGGTTSGLRAVNVAYLMGFRKIILFGMDSCLGKNQEKRVTDKRLADNVMRVPVVLGNPPREFMCNAAMAAQAHDFQSIWDIMPELNIEVRGDGLLAEIVKQRQLLGYKT